MKEDSTCDNELFISFHCVFWLHCWVSVFQITVFLLIFLLCLVGVNFCYIFLWSLYWQNISSLFYY